MANKQLEVLIKQRQDAHEAEKAANAGKKNFKPKVWPMRPEEVEARRKTLEAELTAVAKTNIDRLVCDMNSMKFIRYGNIEQQYWMAMMTLSLTFPALHFLFVCLLTHAFAHLYYSP
jgi:hypothetical protein